MKNYTQQLARLCSYLHFDTIPRRVRGKTKFLVVDNLANFFGEATLEFGTTLAEYAQPLQGHEEATALHFAFRTSARTAAFVNGSLAETLEIRDGYTEGEVAHTFLEFSKEVLEEQKAKEASAAILRLEDLDTIEALIAHLK